MSFPHGFLVIDKPGGVTSFSMVSLVRRLTGVRRVGHAGTLDPLATGVLPVAIGQAARLIEYLDDEKVYEADVSFGTATDTYDSEGAITSQSDVSLLTRSRVESALEGFIGRISQMPPAYSAIKVAGKPLYRYAREGSDVVIVPRLVRIDSIALSSFEDGVAQIQVRCGQGTYIRSLAHDTGQVLGCGAHLTALRRTRSSGFDIHDAWTPADVTTAAAAGTLESHLLAPDRAVEGRPAVILGPLSAADVRAGRDVRFGAPAEELLARGYSISGDFLGLLRSSAGGGWHPEKVLPVV